VEDRIKHHEAPVFFLCGPPPFIEACRGVLTGMDVKPERIKQESFGGPVPKRMKSDPAEPEPGAVLVFARSGKSCTVRRGQSLLEAAEEHGVAIPFSCRQGQCGTCKTKLLEGSVRMDAEHGLDQDSKVQGFVLTCVGHAQGAVKLDA
jgi:ferredoxin